MEENEKEEEQHADEMRTSISELLHGLDLATDSDANSEQEEKISGKRPADSEDERCPKKVKVDIHRLDDPSPCKHVEEENSPSGEKKIDDKGEQNLHKNIDEKFDEDTQDEDAVNSEREKDGESNSIEEKKTEEVANESVDTNNSSKEESNANTGKESEVARKEETGKNDSNENSEEITKDSNASTEKENGQGAEEITKIETEKENDKGAEENTEIKESKEDETKETEKDSDTELSEVKTGVGQITDREVTEDRMTAQAENVLEPTSETSRPDGDSVQEIASDEEVVPRKKRVTNCIYIRYIFDICGLCD